MIISQLDIEGYRAFRNDTLKLHPRLTVLVGTNGAGKSGLLDALFLMLSQYSARLIGSRSSAQRIKDTDMRVGSSKTRLHLTVSDKSLDSFSWELLKQPSKRKVLSPQSSNLSQLNNFIEKTIRFHSDDGNEYLRGEILPVYYSQSGANMRVPIRRRSSNTDVPPETIVRDSMSNIGVNLPALSHWFQDRETAELREQRRNRDYLDPQLEAVRSAMTSATELQNPYFSTSYPRGLTFEKQGLPLHISQLSTGERSFLSLAGDLARRLSIMSQPEESALEGRAIVLIDELELHLHPQWQRKITPWLLETFPNCQFIVSTHSPQVISAISAEHVRILVDHGPKVGTTIANTNWTKGRDSNHLLGAIFDTKEREDDAYRLLQEADRAITSGRLDIAACLIDDAESAIEGSAPEIAILRNRLARRQS